MEAIVLAGGFGTRLQSVVSDIPKPMAPVAGKAFLEYLFKYLKKNGIKKVILSVGYKWEVINQYFGTHFEDMELHYSVEGEPLGTGGAIKKAMTEVNSDNVFIINGDTFFNIDLKVLETKLKVENSLVLALKTMHNFDRYGCVESNTDALVTAFYEKEYRKIGNINGGIYLAKKNIFETYNLSEKFSFEEFMQNNVSKLKIASVVFDNYFIDIGIPEDYKKAQRELSKYI